MTEMQSPLCFWKKDDVILLKQGVQMLAQSTPYPERGPCQKLLDVINQKIQLEQMLKERT